MEVVADCVKQVGFAQADAATEKDGIVFGWPGAGSSLSRCIGELVGRTCDKRLERVPRVERRTVELGALIGL